MKPLKKFVILLKMSRTEGPSTESFTKRASSTRMTGMRISIMEILPGAPYDSSLPQRHFGGWSYKYPPTTTLQGSKHSLLLIQYKSNTQHSKTQIKASDQIKVHNSTLVLRTCEKIDLSSFVVLVAWLAFFFLSFLLSKPCKQSKRHQLCGGPCGV
jgi:hypothetical protein